MKAAILYAPGDLRVEEREKPVPGEKDVIVRVHCAGVCGSDIPRIMVTGTYHFPTIPGHEFAGEVDETGSQVTAWKPGDRVVVTPLMPCGTCRMCREGHFGQCEQYNFLGSRTDGGFAEYVRVPEKYLQPLPEKISYREGAMIEPAAVTIHGLYKLELCGKESVAVFGCGSIGLQAVSLLKLMGAARVAAIDIDPAKLELAKAYGADLMINSLEEDPVRRIRETFERGVDCTVETAGTPVTQEQCVRAVKDQGRVLFLGTAHRDVVFPPATFEHIVRGEVKLFGSWNSYSSPYPGKEWSDIIGLLESSRLSFEKLVTHTLRLEEMPRMIADMAARKFPYCKVLFEMDET